MFKSPLAVTLAGSVSCPKTTVEASKQEVTVTARNRTQAEVTMKHLSWILWPWLNLLMWSSCFKTLPAACLFVIKEGRRVNPPTPDIVPYKYDLNIQKLIKTTQSPRRAPRPEALLKQTTT